MKDNNRIVCIAAHLNDREIAEEIKRELEGIGISSRIACGDNIEEQNIYAAICDAAVVVISENTESSPKGSVERVVNKLTSKTTVRYTAEEVEFSPSMQYYMQKTREFKAADGPEAFVQEMKKILEGIDIKKDILIAAEEKDMESAEALKTEFEGRCCSCITAYNKEDFKNFLDRCYVVVSVGGKKDEGFYKAVKESAKKSRTPLIAFEETDVVSKEEFDKKIEKTIKILAAKKSAAKTLSVNDTGKIKLLKKPYVPLVLGLVLVQACVVLVWLLSVMMQPLFIFPIILLIAGYAALLAVSKKRCSYTHCKEPHNGRKVNIAVFKKSREYTHYFCDKHNNINDVSTNKKRSFLMPALVSAVTVVFALFLIFAVEAEDFSILSIKQAFETLQKVEFADAGFGAFIRNTLDMPDGDVPVKKLLNTNELYFNAENVTLPINSLEDLKYFPNLVVFECNENMDMRGDIKCFEYTPKLQKIEMGNCGLYGDISVLSQLNELESINKDYQHQEIYGEISALGGLDSLVFVIMPQCEISGDIGALSELNLNTLILNNTNVHGEFSSFRNMSELHQLGLSSTEVTGELHDLTGLKNLHILEMGATRITGSLDVLKEFSLNGFDLNSTVVTGDLSVLAEIKPLDRFIRLKDCGNLTGDISVFQELDSSINYIDLSGDPQIEGDVSVFSRFEGLDMLYLGWSPKIKGEISSIGNLKELKLLNVDGTLITGDIAGMSEMTGLDTFRICDTSLYGDISAFSGMHNLSSAVMHGMDIWGDVAVFKNMERLNCLLIQDTDVYGDLSELDALPALEELGPSEKVWRSTEKNAVRITQENALDILLDPLVVFEEDAAGIAGNDAASFGDAAMKRLSDDGKSYQFMSDENGAYMISPANLEDFGELRGNNQAVMIKFRTNNTDGLTLCLFGKGEVVLNFLDGRPHFTHVNEGFMAPYSEYMPTDLALQSGKWYWALMAFDENGNYRSLVWEDGNEDNIAFCRENMGGRYTDYGQSSWHLTIGLAANQTLDVAEYKILDFARFKDE